LGRRFLNWACFVKWLSLNLQAVLNKNNRAFFFRGRLVRRGAPTRICVWDMFKTRLLIGEKRKKKKGTRIKGRVRDYFIEGRWGGDL